MTNDENPFFGKSPPPVHMPEIIPVQALEQRDDDDLWDNQPRRYSPSKRLLVFVVAFILFGSGGVYLATQSNSSLQSSADQVSLQTSYNIMDSVGKITQSPTEISSLNSQKQSPIVTSPAMVLPATTTCNTPTITNSTFGFSVGQPTKWVTTVHQGIVVVAPEATWQTVAFLLPIKLADASLSESVTKTVTDNLLQNLSTFGVQLTVANGDLLGTVNGISTSGWLTSSVTNSDLLIRGGWSPTSDWPSMRNVLTDIGNCFQTTLGTVFPSVTKTITDNQNTTVFTAAYPRDWTMTNLSSNGFDLQVGPTTSIRYQHVEGLLGSGSTVDLLTQTLPPSSYQELTILGDSPMTEVIDNQGLTWQTQTRSYTARVSGQLLRGTVTVAVANSDSEYGFGSYAAITIHREAELYQWSDFNSLSATVQESLTITSPKAGQGLTLAATDPGTVEGPFNGRILSSSLVNQFGSAAKLLIGTYETVKADNGELFLAPFVNFDRVTKKFIFEHDGQRDMLSTME